MTTSSFRESFQFRQYDLLFALVAVLALSLFLIIEQFDRGADAYARIAALSVVAIGVMTYLVHLLMVRQRIRLTERKLKVDQRSLVRKKTRIPLEAITEVREEHYPVFAQRYGQSGWLSGERFVSLVGRNGVAIKTANGSRYFIGSRRARELAEALRQATRRSHAAVGAAA